MATEAPQAVKAALLSADSQPEMVVESLNGQMPKLKTVAQSDKALAHDLKKSRPTVPTHKPTPTTTKAAANHIEKSGGCSAAVFGLGSNAATKDGAMNKSELAMTSKRNVRGDMAANARINLRSCPEGKSDE